LTEQPTYLFPLTEPSFTSFLFLCSPTILQPDPHLPLYFVLYHKPFLLPCDIYWPSLTSSLTMALILELPVELVDEIIGHLADNSQDWRSLSLINSSFYYLAVQHKWRSLSTEQKYQLMMWACAAGNSRTLHRALKFGVTPNLHFQVRNAWSLADLSPTYYTQSIYQARHDPVFIPYMDTYYDFSTHTTVNDGGSFWRPLHVAVQYGHIEIIEILLQHGALIDTPSTYFCRCSQHANTPHYLPSRYTPLHVAMCTRQEGIAKLLLSRGALIYMDYFIRGPILAYFYPSRR